MNIQISRFSMILAGATLLSAGSAFAQYKQSNLTGNVPGLALHTDPNLVNPWGLAFFPTSPFWTADNGTGLSTLYNHFGAPLGLVVTIPSAGGGTAPGTPTGIVANSSSGFVVSANGKSGSAPFIFDSLDGTISGWSPSVDLTHAIIAVDNSATRAFYTGLAIGRSGGVNYIYAADSNNNKVDMYDENFTLVKSFTDTTLPAGYTPFGIQNIHGLLYVTFAGFLSGAPGGFVDVFDTAGNFVRNYTSAPQLNLPWGLAQAPSNFGPFSNDILIGNLGDGRINAFAGHGVFKGTLTSTGGKPISIDGLWAIEFGGGSNNNGATNQLFFTAGPQFYAQGLFGMIQPSGSAAE